MKRNRPMSDNRAPAAAPAPAAEDKPAPPAAAPPPASDLLEEDRIQQAAYALCDEAGQLQQHLKVGRSLLAHSTQLQDDLYAILEQLRHPPRHFEEAVRTHFRCAGTKPSNC